MYMHIWFEFKNKGHVVKKINFPSKGATITFFWTKKKLEPTSSKLISYIKEN